MKTFVTVVVTATLLMGGILVAQPSPASAAPSAAAKAKAKARESKADDTANVETNREVIQSLEHAKKQLESEKGKDAGAHRANAITLIQRAMGEIRAQTSKPGH